MFKIYHFFTHLNKATILWVTFIINVLSKRVALSCNVHYDLLAYSSNRLRDLCQTIRDLFKQQYLDSYVEEGQFSLLLFFILYSDEI